MHVNPNVFDQTYEKVQKVPLRQGFGEGLVLAAAGDARVVALCADLTASTKMDLFARKHPERFIQAGIAEQSMASVAAGLAAMGKTPFIASYAMFSPGRNWEQIRTTVCYNNVPVQVVGAHAGVSVGPDGGTHQAIEDIALMRVVPNMRVVVPCDAIEARKATIAMAAARVPHYLRLAREATPIITTEDAPFEIGRASIVFRPEGFAHVGIIASGPVLYNALRAAKALDGMGIAARVMNLSTVKPLDGDAVARLARETGRIVTVEEHQIAGGMGSAVAEFLAETHPVRVRRMGIRDMFGQSGKPEELLRHYGLDTESIIKVAGDIVAQG